MCGFVGFWRLQPKKLDNLKALVSGMADTIRHRGPDDSGAWADAHSCFALAHRRLSIIDLSAAGHQPMRSASGRFILAYNGEVYNHLDIRTELQATGRSIAWHGHSDTETLLAAFEYWGVEATLTRTVGMFAIALWDISQRSLYLARDRFGEKPLYYGWVGNGEDIAFVFGSELKALRAYPGFANPISREVLALYMRFSYVPTPHSIYQDIYKLEPGCLLNITGIVPPAPSQPPRSSATHGGLRLCRWWSLRDVVETGAKSQVTNETEAEQELDQRLQDAVRLQSLADVPLGAFLSGGVDSSAIIALMQQQAIRPVKTFTVGFEEAAFDESPYACAVARHLGTDHTELFVTATEAQAVIPHLSAMYDEPFADSSQIPTHLVCRAAHTQVTVALSGDAGDELFGGYNRYFWVPRIWKRMSKLPYPVRRILGSAMHNLPLAGWDALSYPLNIMLPGTKGVTRVGDKAHKLATRLIGVRDLDGLYSSLVSEWLDPAQMVKVDDGLVREPLSLLADPLPKWGVEQHELRMMYLDSITYLSDDILCKVDRAAMAISLETRVPFLDHRVAELAWRLPLKMKIRDGQGKWLLRQVLYKYVPRELIERPKVGFGIPVGQWLRGPLRDWAESLLDEKRLQAEGYFYPAPIRTKWIEHLGGRRDHTASLWTVLMFQAWLEKNK
ncbi:asparagine synthase (glutamine-hydrolyzing) [Methylovulum psychrotolerans]|uniref:asparagine synthase (glutamine-hydrolyzing) n=1 Tax=Methylovulum psychrotolerans TaxID=1704499 RepID=UPI0032EC3FD4